MLWAGLWLVAALLVGAFAYVLFAGAPYLPTLPKKIDVALDLLDLGPGKTLVDLGSGDGSVLLAAAQRGLNGVGYELNPFLVLVSRLRLWRYRGKVRIVWGNYWGKNLSEADGIFYFGLQRDMKKLDKKLAQNAKKPVKLASFAFKIPGRQPAAEQDGVYLYVIS